MTKLFLLLAMLLLPMTSPAMHSEKLTIIAPKEPNRACPLSLMKRIRKQSVRYCVFVTMIGEHNGSELSVDTVLSLAQEIINDTATLEASRLFYQMAELPSEHIQFLITVKLDVLVSLETL